MRTVLAKTFTKNGERGAGGGGGGGRVLNKVSEYLIHKLGGTAEI